MDNPTRWNITNSAQNIVSALVDPSKQFDHVFRRDWTNTFSCFSKHKPSMKSKHDIELKAKLKDYVKKLEERKYIKDFEAQNEAKFNEQDNSIHDRRNDVIVPEVFLLGDFDLSNAEVFSEVISSTNKDKKHQFEGLPLDEDSYSEIQQQFQSSLTISDTKLFTRAQLKELQQDFTDYLDIIEEKLASQISNRSGDFFQVMSSVDSVMDELSLAIKSVTSLRKKCSTLNDALILPNIKNIHLSKTRNNAQVVLDKMKEISELCKVQPTIQLLLSTSDFVGALDLIAKSRLKLHELTRVVCLKHLESQLVEIERVIGIMMQQEFVTLITSEWNRPLNQIQTTMTGNDLSSLQSIDSDIIGLDSLSINNDSSNNYSARLFEHERILCIVQGMIRINKLNFGEYFQQEARIAISTCVKQTLIELLSDDDDYLTTHESEVSHDVYKKVQLITYKKWINLIKIVLSNLLCILKRVKVVYSVISTSLDEVHVHLTHTLSSYNNLTGAQSRKLSNSPNSVMTGSNVINQQSKNFVSNFEALPMDSKRATLTNIKTGKDGLKASLLTVCSFAEQLALNLIECRIKESNFDKLLATEFINLSKLVGNFTSGFSEICDRHSVTLMSLLQTQAEKFVNKFHEERKRRIESNLDIEQWKMVEDVPRDFQKLITLIVDEDISISETFTIDTPSSRNSISRQHSRASSDTAVSAMDNTRNSMNQRSIDPKHMIIDSNTPGKQTTYVSANLTSNNESNNNNNNIGRPKIHTIGITKISYISANGSTYVIVNSVINLIRILMDYCKCAYDIRSLSADLLERLFKILQLYNSKTYHLVYSAGAIQVAGLKTITTRSLIVSQRSLKLIILLIPAIQRHFSQLLPDDALQRLRRFDEIKLSYEDHAAKIPERVNCIVKDVINLQLQEWEAKPPVPSPQFTAVAQHLMRLHDNIQDALPPDELKLLFLKISQTFKDVLIEHLRRLNINNDTGPQQWLVTQELTFYKISSEKLSVFKGWELDYEDLWARLNSESDPNISKEQQEKQQQQQQQKLKVKSK